MDARSAAGHRTGRDAAADAPVGRCRRVLLVDDNADYRLLLRLTVESAGWAVVGEAGDGQDGIELAAARQPDLVLLDLDMPVLSGMQALPSLRAVAPQARVVIVTAHPVDAVLTAAVAAGAHAVVNKSGTPGLLTAALDDVA